jgi:FkbM family methyltransferase
VAIEFEEANYQQLLRNTAHCPTIECVHAGLWPTDGRVAVANPDAQKWAHFPSEVPESSADTHSVRAISMPTLMHEYGIEHIDLLKIDIEGSEYELFQTPPAWLDQVGTLAIELHDHLRPGAGERFLAALAAYRPRIQCKGEYLVCQLTQPQAHAA